MEKLHFVFFTDQVDYVVLTTKVEIGIKWLESVAKKKFNQNYDFLYKDPITLTGTPDTWWGQVWDHINLNYPIGNYVCFVQGAGGMAGGVGGKDGNYGVAVVGDWCIRSIVDGKTPLEFNGETLPDWIIESGMNGQMGAWIHEMGHVVGANHEDGGVMLEWWNWPKTSLPQSYVNSQLFPYTSTASSSIVTIINGILNSYFNKIKKWRGGGSKWGKR